ncbi:MAG: hypothetical protein AAF773_12620 [Cyanobacteria bacterium P01_D01_bin.115]
MENLIDVRTKFWGYSIAILMLYGFSGYCLSVYQAGTLAWTLTGLIILYVAATGKGGIVLANALLTMILIFFTVGTSWPTIRLAYLPLKPVQFWALSLLLLWFLGELAIFLLASYADFLSQHELKRWQRTLMLSCFSWLAMGLGNLVFNWISIWRNI